MGKRIIKLIGGSVSEAKMDREQALRLDIDYYLGELSVAKEDGNEEGISEAIQRLNEIHSELQALEDSKNVQA